MQSGLHIPISCHIYGKTRKPWVQARVQLKVIGAWTETYPDTVMVRLGTTHMLTLYLFRAIHRIHKWQTQGKNGCLVMKGGIAGETKIASDDFQ